jgi:hypothetical protein
MECNMTEAIQTDLGMLALCLSSIPLVAIANIPYIVGVHYRGNRHWEPGILELIWTGVWGFPGVVTSIGLLYVPAAIGNLIADLLFS